MEAEKLQKFLIKTDNYLPTIRSNILICVRDGNTHGELKAALHQIRTIVSEAKSANLKEIIRTAERIEKDLAPLAAKDKPLTEEESRKLLDSLAVLEAYLTKLSFTNDVFAMDVADFVEESFDNLTISNSSEDDEWANEWEEEFEIDEEMLEVFALEAEDLLRNINAHLELLEGNPNNREALLEIRRNAHTLKGSAGIIGLRQLSALAHRVEDLLDYLAENDVEADVKIFEILLASTDCFETLANGESSQQVDKKVARLYKNFDEIFVSLQNKESQQNQTAKSVEPINAVSESAPNLASHENRSTIRVSIDKLDELVKLVGDLLVSRSVFEQRLSEFSSQIEELHNSTNRLQQASGKLEIDFGSNQLQISNYKFPAKNFSLDQQARTISEFDTLEFDRYTEFHQTTRELAETTADASAISGEMDSLKDHLEQLFDSQRRAIEEMQEKLLRLRMVKFGTLSGRLHRTVRMTCEEEEKFADLIIEGENLEFDTQILDSLIEPLLHLLRNAVAHGIEPPETRRLLGKPETGRIGLKIHSDGTHISLTISDDGRGISAASLIEKAVEHKFISRQDAEVMREEEAFDLMFLPGLTTAERISQIAGRGVGMNIVKTNIARQQGTITVKSKPQKGSVFTVRMPMALAVNRALLVKCNDQTIAFPLKSVKQATEILPEFFDDAKRSSIVKINEIDYIPANLNELLGKDFSVNPDEQIPLLLIESDNKRFALTVDEIIKTEEIIIKPLGFPLQSKSQFLGAAILGDGRVIPVLDIIHLLTNKIESSAHEAENIQIPPSEAETVKLVPLDTNLKIMIVDDSPSVRHITVKLIKNNGWESITAKDGLDALEVLQNSSELPDVILSDVEMPRMNGYELLAALKQQEEFSHIPVIMITSRASEKHRQKAIQLGVSEYLTKPFHDWVLIESINLVTQK